MIAEINDYQFKVVKIKGDFVWHSHEDTDEVFMIIQGSMVIDFRDKQVTLSEGDMYVVPKGVEHKPYAEVLLGIYTVGCYMVYCTDASCMFSQSVVQ